MSKETTQKNAADGAGCAVFLLAGIVYSLLYNDGRWVREMDLEEHVFSAKNIPMLAAGMLVALYAVYIAVVILESPQGPFHTKRVFIRITPAGCRPSSVCSGIFGLLGLSGFWTCHAHGIVSPFLLFALFGLFGLFLRESFHTLWRTSCFSRTKARADLKVYKTGFLLLVAVILLSRWRVLALHAEWCAIFLLIPVLLIVAFVLFQKRYLLCCYEKEE